MSGYPKNWKSAILVAAGFAGLVVVSYGQITDFLGSGSIKSFDKCFQSGKSGGSATSQTIKKVCIEKHQRPIEDTLKGEASYDGCLPKDEWDIARDSRGEIDYANPIGILKNKDVPRMCGEFSGTFSNESAKFVVTSVTVVVKHSDAPEEESTIDGLWLEAGQPYHFSFNLKQKIPRADKGKFKWSISSVRGFAVDY